MLIYKYLQAVFLSGKSKLKNSTYKTIIVLILKREKGEREFYLCYVYEFPGWLGIRPESRQEPIIQGSVALMRSLEFTLREKWATRGF